MQTLLRAENISKSFSGVHALRSASFELRSGEVHALIGENGAGKSTLIKAITGALEPDAGTLTVLGQVIERNSPGLARSLGIAAIYQQPALFPDLTVTENIGLSLESGSLWQRVRWGRRRELARQLLAKVGSDLNPDRLVESLSMPEQQIVEIAKAVGANARIVIMDEPTASLTDREVERLFETIRLLRDSGAGLIYISHRLAEISAIGDRVTVLRDGQTIATRNLSEVDRQELIRMMVGRDLTAVFPKRTVPVGEIALEIRNLTNRAAGIRDVSFSVRRGEMLGIAGLVGSGRTELAQTLFGLTPADTGTVLVNGRPVSITSPAEAIRHGIAYVPEDRRQHGIVLEFPVSANISLASLGAIANRGLINFGEERALAQRYVDAFRIKTPSVESETGHLSGGNQQKVAVARWLATQPSVVILDEPTQGVDVGSKSEIHGLMVELAEQGLAIVMISSELPEILGMSDRIAVMHAGTLAGVLDRENATPDRILSMALGHSLEPAA